MAASSPRHHADRAPRVRALAMPAEPLALAACTAAHAVPERLLAVAARCARVTLMVAGQAPALKGSA